MLFTLLALTALKTWADLAGEWEKGCIVSNEKLGPQLEHLRKACPRQKPMESKHGQWPMLQLELRDKSRLIKNNLVEINYLVDRN